ncbi:MAG: hypothetical protein V1753_06470 [Pseudomonadota bacterium]
MDNGVGSIDTGLYHVDVRPEKPAAAKKKEKESDPMMDFAVGMDVRYALNHGERSLIKRLMNGPVTLEEYQALERKLMEMESRPSHQEKQRSGKVCDGAQFSDNIDLLA